MSELKDKVVIVTGASSGIGEGITYHLSSYGMKLSLIARNEQKLKNVVEHCISKGLDKERIVYTIGDLSEESVRRKLIASTVRAFGVIDVLVNNAGIVKVEPVSDISEEDYRLLMEVNQTAPFLLTQLAIPHLKKSKGGNIINISSISSHSAPAVGFSCYAMTKAALNIFTKYLAVELADCGIRANTISSGVVKTDAFNVLEPDEKKRNAIWDMQIPNIPVGRLGTPQDIAEAVVFLISASWMTGENMILDGGQLFYKPSNMK